MDLIYTAYSIGVVNCYMEAPTTTHMTAVKQILRNVKGTINLGCHNMHRKDSGLNNNSDLAGDVDDRKSTTSVIYFLRGNPIT